MYANTKEREDMYENVLHQWLTKSSLDIFTVDSSGSTKFSTPSPQFSKWKGALSFDQGPKLNKCYSKLEMEAIKKAEEFFDFSNYSIIMKVTGKYYVNGLDNFIHNYNVPNVALILQNRHNFFIEFQNSELFGFRNGDASKIMDCFYKGFEQTLYKYSLKLKNEKKIVSRLPKLNVETNYKRGDGSVLLHL